MGRPPTRPKGLKDGFYIEVRNKRAGTAVKIRSDTKPEMLRAIEHYKLSKEVVVLGEHKNGEWLDANGKPIDSSKSSKRR